MSVAGWVLVANPALQQQVLDVKLNGAFLGVGERFVAFYGGPAALDAEEGNA